MEKGSVNPKTLANCEPGASSDQALTFLHLSDIHFRNRLNGTQFDLEKQLRRLLLEDIESKPANGAAYDGLFITGDIAFGGQKAEFDHAKTFVSELFTRARILPERTYVVPGNHDVDRNMVVTGGAIYNNQIALRNKPNHVERRELFEIQLTRDPACNPLALLEKYNEFAQGYGCRTEKSQLAWMQPFALPLNDGSILRIHGLNSALNSNEHDSVGKLYLSPFQTSHFVHDKGFVNVALCHHPPNWLLDKTDVESAFYSYIQLALFGHEHEHRSIEIENSVHLYAGAVHPAARDPHWLPTYHIIRLHVAGSGRSRKLVVRIFSRELRANSHAFVPRMSMGGSKFDEKTIDLQEWPSQVDNSSSGVTAANNNMPPNGRDADDISQSEVAIFTSFRELLSHFHQLSTPVRYNIATTLGLLRDGDDLPPQKQWDLVFKRAKDENKLDQLWTAVGKVDAVFGQRPNPYKTS